MGIVVQKFGGTSLATKASREKMLFHIKKALEQDKDVVVVVSAIGRKGDSYSTDNLIGLLEEIDNNIHPETKDMIMSCGEVISASLICHYLNSKGIQSKALTGFQAGILTDSNHGISKIFNIDTNNIKNHLRDGKVVVITGFQGIDNNGNITTLGRGGSDTSAIEIGGYLDADEVYIYTDVEGVAVVDPRIIDNPQYINCITYDKMYKIALSGAKVIHPRAVEAANKFNIPLRILSTFSTEAKGTLICSQCNDNLAIWGIPIEKNYCALQLSKKLKISEELIKNDDVFIKEKENIYQFILKENELINNIVSSINEDTEKFIIRNIVKISVFYSSSYELSINKRLNNLLSYYNKDILDIFKFDDHLTIFTKENKMIEIIQNIYEDTLGEKMLVIGYNQLN